MLNFFLSTIIVLALIFGYFATPTPQNLVLTLAIVYIMSLTMAFISIDAPYREEEL